jgi:hypothetical protein
VADFAPLSVRRAALLDVGGLDEGMAEPGQCGIASDWELCTRLWVAGWQVGYMHVETKQQGMGEQVPGLGALGRAGWALRLCCRQQGRRPPRARPLGWRRPATWHYWVPFKPQALKGSNQRGCRAPCAGGTHLGKNGPRCWAKQQGLGHAVYQWRFGTGGSMQLHDELLPLVQAANLDLHLNLPGNECPYKAQHCQGLPYSAPKQGRGW